MYHTDVAAKPDHKSPVPLYHQLVETLRYRIATGQLRPGDALPSLRAASKRWGVHWHTVRHAYGELAEAGLVVIRCPQGARVKATLPAPSANLGVEGLADFLADVSTQARERFGLSASRLSELLAASSAASTARSPNTATFVECNDSQAKDYADQVMDRWSATVRAWSLDEAGEPPPGPILATFFHFIDVRSRWPHRHADMRFLPVTVAPSLVEELSRRRKEPGPIRVMLAETNEARGRAAVADLLALLPADRFQVTAYLARRVAVLLEKDAKAAAVLFAPRLWSRLSARERKHPKAVQLRYAIEPEALAELGDVLGWTERRGARTRAG